MGFKAVDERAEEAVRAAATIPVIPPEIQQDMNEC
jgi:hypothetical protein